MKLYKIPISSFSSYKEDDIEANEFNKNLSFLSLLTDNISLFLYKSL